MDWGDITIDTNGTFEEGPVRISDSRDQVLQRKTVRLVKMLWQHRGVKEATWERGDTMRATIFSYLRMKVRGLIFHTRILLHMHVFVCASMCEFRGRNSIKGGRM